MRSLDRSHVLSKKGSVKLHWTVCSCKLKVYWLCRASESFLRMEFITQFPLQFNVPYLIHEARSADL